jgi:hypothetical protein
MPLHQVCDRVLTDLLRVLTNCALSLRAVEAAV